MIKLIDLLEEVLRNEGIVKVPESELTKTEKVYSYINANKNSLVNKVGKDYNHPYIDPKLKDYFKLDDLKKNQLRISIGLYNDSKDAGMARMNTKEQILLVNLAHLKDLDDFEETVEHELVHAMDPKVSNQKVWSSVAKKYVEPKGSKLNLSKSGDKSEYEKSLEKYLKQPWEFDAFVSPLVNKVKTNINKIQDAGDKKSYIKSIISLLGEIPKKSTEELISDEDYEKLPWFFSKSEWDSNNYNKAKQDFYSDLYKMKAWSTKPTLYKRFINKLYKEIS